MNDDAMKQLYRPFAVAPRLAAGNDSPSLDSHFMTFEVMRQLYEQQYDRVCNNGNGADQAYFGFMIL
jgi:hypothetical protein